MDQENNTKAQELLIPELAMIELGNGVFDKPGVLGDLITSYATGRVIIACENPNDIRFVESILIRRGLEIRRVSPIIDEGSIKSVASWFEGKNEANIVCHLTVAETICKLVPTQMLVLYNPTCTEGLSEINKEKKSSGTSMPIVALVSPQELPAFLISCKSYNKEFTSFEVKKPLVTKKTFELLNTKLSKTKISSQMPIQEIAAAIKNSEISSLLSGTTLEQKIGTPEEIISKLLSFFVENSTSSNAASIDEDLGLTTVKNEKFSESNSEDSRESSHRRDDKREDRRESGSRDRDSREDTRGNSDRRSNSENRPRQEDRRQDNRQEDRSSDRRAARSSYDEPNQEKYSQTVIRYRTYFGAGELDELNVPNLRAVLYEYLPDSARINRVHIRDNYSFVDIDSSDLDLLIQCTENIQIRGRLINTDIAEILGPVDDDRNNRNNNRRGSGNRNGGNRNGGNRNGGNRNGGNRNYNNDRRDSRGYNQGRNGNQRNNRREQSSY